jgi:hypothetical protein
MLCAQIIAVNADVVATNEAEFLITKTREMCGHIIDAHRWRNRTINANSRRLEVMIGELTSQRDRLNRAILALRELIGEEAIVEKLVESPPFATDIKAIATRIKKARKDKGGRCLKCPDKPVFKTQAEYFKHRYQVHVKPGKKGTAKTAGDKRSVGWNKFPINTKSAEKKRREARAQRTGPVDCLPCELKFANIEALEEHQADAHGVKFPAFA